MKKIENITTTVSSNEQLAQNIRDLRTRKKMTVRELARKINRSIGFISQIERGISEPSVEDLNAISLALEVSSTYFQAHAIAPHQQWVTRKNDRRVLRYANGVADQVISPTVSKKFTMLETFLESGSEFDERTIFDSVEQGGYVLEGELTMWIDGEEIKIKAGDGFQIEGSVPCRFVNKSKSLTRVLWIYG